jgi:single-strand DNA-binding protein
MNETFVTVVGNLVDDPKLRTIEAGQDVAGFRVASTSRRFDRDSQRWTDSAQLFLAVSCWRALAGNATASLRKGDPVVVTGKLTTRTYEKDGQTRSVCELEALAIGPDLARGTAVFRRSPRSAEDGGGEPGGGEPGGAGADESRLVGAGV